MNLSALLLGACGSAVSFTLMCGAYQLYKIRLRQTREEKIARICGSTSQTLIIPGIHNACRYKKYPSSQELKQDYRHNRERLGMSHQEAFNEIKEQLDRVYK